MKNYKINYGLICSLFDFSQCGLYSVIEVKVLHLKHKGI